MLQRITVSKMNCNGCSRRVNETLSAMAGVSNIKINLNGAYAEFESASPINIKELNDLFKQKDYEYVATPYNFLVTILNKKRFKTILSSLNFWK
jgi:copper chaperone CopZ